MTSLSKSEVLTREPEREPTLVISHNGLSTVTLTTPDLDFNLSLKTSELPTKKIKIQYKDVQELYKLIKSKLSTLYNINKHASLNAKQKIIYT